MNMALNYNISQAAAMLESLAALDTQVLDAVRLIAGALNGGHKLLVCGNGGSAAEAAHLTTEFICRFDRDRRPYPAICLSAHGGDVTAIGNDYAFADIFVRQLEAFAQTGDVLVAFSTSGNSENVCRALQGAARLKIQSIALLGRTGGRCAGLATVELIVRNEVTARIQEAHQFLLHTICEMVEPQLKVHP